MVFGDGYDLRAWLNLPWMASVAMATKFEKISNNSLKYEL